MRLSVIIPCLNAADTLPTQLAALAQQECPEPWEIVVADNGSTDASREVVRAFQAALPNLRLVDAPDRRGPAHPLNVAASASTGEVLAFCDADDKVAKGWVQAMSESLRHHEFVCGRLEWDELNAPWVQRSRPPVHVDGLQPYRRPDYLPHAAGANFGIARTLFDELGGFDEALYILQDTDLCWRAQLSGHELVFVPEAVVHYRLRDSFRGIYRQARNYADYNVLLYKRYRPRGMPKRHWVIGVGGWLALPLRLLRVRDRGSLGEWIWALGWRVGRLKGSIKHRQLAF